MGRELELEPLQGGIWWGREQKKVGQAHVTRVTVEALRRARKRTYKRRALAHPGRSLGSAGMDRSRDVLFINGPGGLEAPQVHLAFGSLEAR